VSAAYLLAWMLPLAAGVMLALALSAPRRSGRPTMALGYGIVLGMLLCGGLSALTARAETQRAWEIASPWLGAVGIIAIVIGIYRQRKTPARGVPAADDKVEYWRNTAIALALASLVWRGSILAGEVLLRPTYPWDAWDAWEVKSKAWYLAGHFVPFVSIGQWLSGGSAQDFSGPAWAYPSLLSWIQVWFASAAGSWVEPLVNLPWFALWIGLLLGHYGQWRALGLPRPHSAVAVYLLGSLPLLSTHVALAGYADLWVATLFGFAALAWLRWQERGERDQLVLALICACALPLLKFEGMVWCLALLAAIAIGTLPSRWRWRAVAAASALLVLLALVGQTQILFAAIGWVRSGSRVIDIPVIGNLAIRWHGDAALGIIHSLFTQSNWHILWWIVPPLIVWRWRALRDSSALGLFAMLLLGCFGLLVFLFVFTDAAEWAESYTSVNRLIMHITPGVVSLLALLCRDLAISPEANGTVPAAGPLNDPA